MESSRRPQAIPGTSREFRDHKACSCRSLRPRRAGAHREREVHWRTKGPYGYLLLLVAHAVQEDDDGPGVIRTIPARRASLEGDKDAMGKDRP